MSIAIENPFPYFLLSVVFFVLFVMMFQPSMEVMALSAIYGVQIINTLYLVNDLLYADIVGDKISLVIILTSLSLLLIASTLIIYGLQKVNMLELNYIMREALTTFEIMYVINYVILFIISVLYFLSTPLKIASVKTCGLTVIELVTIFVKILFGLSSIGLGLLMIYNANLFASFVDAPIIYINKNVLL